MMRTVDENHKLESEYNKGLTFTKSIAYKLSRDFSCSSFPGA